MAGGRDPVAMRQAAQRSSTTSYRWAVQGLGVVTVAALALIEWPVLLGAGIAWGLVRHGPGGRRTLIALLGLAAVWGLVGALVGGIAGLAHGGMAALALGVPIGILAGVGLAHRPRKRRR
jgi:hypothetical protein